MNKLIYFVGIGGAGTSSLARLYIANGYRVIGSDDGDGFYTELLEKDGIEVFGKFSIQNIPYDIDFAVYSTAFEEGNIEILELKKRDVKIFSYPEALGEMTKKYTTIAVCGTHGKTTTTAMTAYALIGANKDPNVLVGSIIPEWLGGARSGSSDVFVIEADEYQDKLRYYHPKVIVLTSIDYDHPDFFENFEVYKNVFKKFIDRLPKDGILIACVDDENVRKVICGANVEVISYGESEFAKARIIKTENKNNKQYISIIFEDKKNILTTKMFGIHNAKNAVAAWLVSVLISKGNKLGSSNGLENFAGVARRAEKKGIYNDALLIDDYAHHPREISTTLKSFKKIYKDKKIIAAFHPHTYSRTEALFNDFVKSLLLADEVIIIDIYSSAREKTGKISSKDLVEEINKIQKKAIYKKTIKNLSEWALNNLEENDIFITLGAGDIWKVHDIILNN